MATAAPAAFFAQLGLRTAVACKFLRENCLSAPPCSLRYYIPPISMSIAFASTDSALRSKSLCFATPLPFLDPRHATQKLSSPIRNFPAASASASASASSSASSSSTSSTSSRRRPRKTASASVPRRAAAALAISLGLLFQPGFAGSAARAAGEARANGGCGISTTADGEGRLGGRNGVLVAKVKAKSQPTTRRGLFGRRKVVPVPPQTAVQRVQSLVVSAKEKLFVADDGEHGGHAAAINDALILLGTTVAIIPIMQRLNTSPILGFLAAGIALGPNGFALVSDVGTSKALAELGVVFFLFEMGLELSTSKLKSLGSDVFGLGTTQFVVSALLLGSVSMMAGLPVQTAIVVGAGLALSSSAFVLQLLGERGEVGTRYGRAAFGVLLFQDLAVVPVLVLTPLLAGSGGASAVMSAVSVASAKAAVALAFIVLMGKTVLQPVFRFVAKAKSQEAFIAVILFTALGTSALTAGLGLSDTLGAFLAGVMLAETTFRHQVEADIKPFRGLLLGLFFITVGFSIDLGLAFANIGTVASLVIGLLAIKAGVIAAGGALFGLSTGTAIRTGLLLSQGGEFAFVIFGLATQVGVLPAELGQLLLLVVALSMALTPSLAALGSKIASRMESQRGLIGVRKEDADTADARDFVMVAGFGRVGQSVCEMMDKKLVRYVAFDQSPSRVIEARSRGLPVFFGDATRPELLKAAGVQRARAVVVTLDDQAASLRAVQSIRREFGPELQIFCRARDAKHQMLLTSAGATAIVPELLEASLLLGGAVLMAYGTPADEVNALITDSRRSNVGSIGTTSQALSDMMGSSFIVNGEESSEVEDPELVLSKVTPEGALENADSAVVPDGGRFDVSTSEIGDLISSSAEAALLAALSSDNPVSAVDGEKNGNVEIASGSDDTVEHVSHDSSNDDEENIYATSDSDKAFERKNEDAGSDSGDKKGGSSYLSSL